jgi:hypothetical protein
MPRLEPRSPLPRTSKGSFSAYTHPVYESMFNIEAENLKMLTIQGVKAFAKYDTRELYLELKPFEEERTEQELVIRQHLEKRRKGK